jgi:hypothetical protein
MLGEKQVKSEFRLILGTGQSLFFICNKNPGQGIVYDRLKIFLVISRNPVHLAGLLLLLCLDFFFFSLLTKNGG